MMEETTQTKFCRNCDTDIREDSTFCWNCGQKYTTGLITVKHVIIEFFSTFFNLDSKFFKTLIFLFTPGKLTTEYFAGRHKRYATPLRLFLVTMVFHFALFAFLFKDGIQINRMSDQTRADRIITKKKTIAEFDTISQNLIKQSNRANILIPYTDSLKVRLQDSIAFDRDSIHLVYIHFTSLTKMRDSSLSVAAQDYSQLEPDSIMAKYNITGTINQMQFERLMRIGKSNDFSKIIFGYLTWMVLITIPIMAFVMYFLYLRKKRYYVEHLVFLFHFHAMAFISMMVGFLLEYFFDIGWVLGIIISGMGLYLLVAMKRYYRQGYIKTFIKYVIVLFMYLTIKSFAFLFAVLLGFLFS